VIGRDVRRAEPDREQARAVRLPRSGKAHQHHERGATVRPLRHADLAAKLRDELTAVLGDRTGLRERRRARAA
jgi:hypothetical protein